MRGRVWTDGEIVDVLQMKNEGHPYSVIGAKYGVTRSAISGLVKRNGAANEGNVWKTWSSEQEDELRQLAATSLSPNEMAHRLGRSAGAIRQKMRQLGIRSNALEGVRLSAARHVSTITVRRTRQEALRPAPAQPVIGKTLLELGAGGCKWPVGEGDGIVFCGNPAAIKSCYCPHHRFMSSRRSEGPSQGA